MKVLLNLILTPFVLMLVGLFGYFVGVVIAVTPFVHSLYTTGLGLSNEAIPTIMAWVFALAFMIGSVTKADNGE